MSEVMDPDDIFHQDRGEREKYKNASVKDEILVPLTKDGFEGLIERLAQMTNLPVNDGLRSVLAGYVHHIPNEQDSATLEALAKVMHKSVSNNTTWIIDQDIKHKRRELALENQTTNKLKQQLLEEQDRKEKAEAKALRRAQSKLRSVTGNANGSDNPNGPKAS